ncbi:MAG: ATP-dependent Clp protease ATP-binding subunit ClpX, partial [Clostridia bacterium]|nr:ATP-dependent Clp protease ATP-binding subunit ClpX [Clostridia bacterium]
TEEAMISILTQPKNALVKQYKRLFEMDNVQLDFEPDALTEVAKLTIKRNTGARGLRAILEDVMLPVMYETPSRSDIEKVIITLNSVRKLEPPKYVIRGEKHEDRIA